MSSVTSPLSQELPAQRENLSGARSLYLVVSVLAASALIFTLAWVAVAWRLDMAPDIFSDEIVYTRVGIRLVSEGALIWDTGNPVFVHPPLYFLVQALYLRLTVHPFPPLYTPGEIFSSVVQARSLNAILAGLTAVALLALGSRLRSLRLGVLLAALFLLDPFGLRINRRAMLETMAALLSLAGAIILISPLREEGKRGALPGAIWGGLFMGAGMLTKELTFTTPLAVLCFGLWEAWRVRSAWRQKAVTLLTPFLASSLAFLTYGLFPIWAFTTGRWDRFVSVKTLSLERLLGLVHTSGWNRPGLTIIDFLLGRLADYGSTYLLMALGGLATIGILLAGRRARAGRFLAAWGMIIYPFFSFLAVFGSGNDQFFYFLLIPAIILTGYALTALPLENRGRKTAPGSSLPFGLSRFLPAIYRHWPLVQKLALISIVLVTFSYNVNRWWRAYGIGQDNGYYQLSQFVQEHVPAGEPINASGDPIKFRYFFPSHPITEAGIPVEAQAAGVHYFVLAPKDIWAKYGRVTTELGTWLVARGDPLFSTTGQSYGDIYLYRVSDLGDEGATPAPVDPEFIHQFPIAQTGFVDYFIGSLALWLFLWGGLASLLWLLEVFGQRRGRAGGLFGVDRGGR